MGVLVLHRIHSIIVLLTGRSALWSVPEVDFKLEPPTVYYAYKGHLSTNFGRAISSGLRDIGRGLEISKSISGAPFATVGGVITSDVYATSDVSTVCFDLMSIGRRPDDKFEMEIFEIFLSLPGPGEGRTKCEMHRMFGASATDVRVDQIQSLP